MAIITLTNLFNRDTVNSQHSSSSEGVDLESLNTPPAHHQLNTVTILPLRSPHKFAPSLKFMNAPSSLTHHMYQKHIPLPAQRLLEYTFPTSKQITPNNSGERVVALKKFAPMGQSRIIRPPSHLYTPAKQFATNKSFSRR